MKIKFEKLSTANGKVYVNFGNGFQEYEISEVKDSGITIPEDCTDYSSIQIKGSSVILNNLDVISSIKTSDDSTISPEDITGIVLKDFKGTFDKSLLKTYPKLTSVTIPDGVTKINSNAFFFCSALTSIVIPDSVTTIGSMVFGECKNLKNIDLPKSISAIGNDAFINCKSLTSISIPDGIKVLGDGSMEGTFAGCTSLTSIIIPDSVTKMRGGIFGGCTSLKTVNYKGTEIQWNAITKGYNWNYNCPSDLVINYNYGKESSDIVMNGPERVSIVIDDSNSYTSVIKSIDNYSQSIVVISGVSAIPKKAFKDIIGISEVVINEGISSIEEFAFDSCSGVISEIIIPNTVTSIDRYAFTMCENLPNVTIPDSVTSIGDYAFSSCLKLTNFYVPDSLTTIPNGMFYDCRGLTSVTIPSNITSIGKNAFIWCINLKTINYKGTKAQWNAISKGTDWNKNCPSDMVINYNYVE